MNRNHWIACAILASAAAIGACSPKGSQAGQRDTTANRQDQAYGTDTSRHQDTVGHSEMARTDRTNTDRTNTNRSERDRSGRDVSELPVTRTVPTGTHIDVTLNDELSSRKNKPGDTFTAKVAEDVRDASGTVVIEQGATVNGNIVAVKPAPNRRTPGTLTLAVTTIETNGKTFPIRATIDSVTPEYRKQPVSGRDAVKVGAGAAAGAVIGQVLSKNTKGTVIGAVVGGMAGAGVAAETKDLDIVLPDDAHIVLMVTEPLKVAVDRDDLQKNQQNSNKRSY